jgi:hypothetical protein
MSLPAEAIERALHADILEVAKRYVALKHVSASEWAGPCPVCVGEDRFSVNTKKQVWNCRGCGKGGGVIALMMHVDEAVETVVGQTWTPRPPRHDTQERDAEHNSQNAVRIWRSSVSIRGTVAERYLAQVRCIEIDQIPDLDDVLRFDPHCPFGDNRLPCLIALVRDVLTDETKAIQRTALAPDGQKIGRRSLGPTKGGAMKLWPDAEVTRGLVVGEGMETVAAAATHVEHRGTLLQPAWALIDSANLSGFPILAGIEALTILVDHDANGVGEKAADTCERRWLNAGREVTQLTPKTLGLDFNDIVRGAK